MSWPGGLLFCVASLSSLESLLSINEDRGYPTEYPTRLRSNSGWMTFAQLWMAVGSKRATLVGHSEGCPMSVLFAATYPERVSKLILFGGYGRRRDLPDNFEELVRERVKLWGTGAMMKRVAPSLAANADAVAQFAKFERLSASPGAVKSFVLLNAEIDVSSILPTVRVPTLVLHRQKDIVIPVDLGRELAAKIHDAKFIEYPGGDHAFFTGDVEALLGDIEEFVTGHRDSLSVKSTGDGILATFDGPGRAVRCALAFGAAAKQIGLPTRAGLHTGEIEIRGRDISGVAVHAAARVMALSQPDEVLVSRVVTDLVAGAGLRFAERGPHELKGLPGRWDLFAASA
jgi:pimeloyl-ACP methyl ester carboxylesterase